MSKISAACQSHMVLTQKVPGTQCSLLRQVKDSRPQTGEQGVPYIVFTHNLIISLMKLEQLDEMTR